MLKPGVTSARLQKRAKSNVAIPTDVRNAIVGAYYPRALAVPDAARSRAQAAYAIASAIAAALVAAGVFGNLDKRPANVQALALTALVLWLIAAGLYLVAVSSPFESASATQTGVDAFVREVLSAAKTERDRINTWQAMASAVSGVAAVVTVAALVTAITNTPSDSQAATVVLTSKTSTAVTTACGRSATKVTGTVSPGDLQKDFVSITLDKGLCSTKKKVMVSVPRGQVRAVAFNR
jgi:hypothetical protein